MNKEFIPYEQALQLKELGFDIRPNFGGNTSLYDKNGNHTFYTNYGVMGSGLSDGYIYAPLFQQAFRWFRDKHGINQQITKTYYEGDFFIWDFYIPTNQYIEIPIRESSDNWNYEITESKCLDKLIEILKRK